MTAEADDSPPPRSDPRWPGLVLELDPGCSRQLNWMLRLPGNLDEVCPQLVTALVQAGVFTHTRQHTGLWLLEAEEGHQCVLVPRTGRVQLRIHPVIPSEQRAEMAWKLASRVGDVLAPLL